MGHLTGKDLYGRLGQTIDSLDMRAPWNEHLSNILRELYTDEEAELIVRMTYAPATFKRLLRVTGYPEVKLRTLLERLCQKGLVMDLWIEGEYRYWISPLMIGIFEFTMMRTEPGLNTRQWARMFYDYFEHDEAFYAANSPEDGRFSFVRALPHEEALAGYVEILDYERAASIVDSADKMAIGLCSCRHEKDHLGNRQCDTPTHTCASFGVAADYLIRHGMAQEVDRAAMLDNLAISKTLGLVLEADNVRENVRFICQCCACCCNVLLAFRRYGYSNFLVTSNYIARVDASACQGCGLCAQACPIEAIRLAPNPEGTEPEMRPEVDAAICLGCGVCALKCPTNALRLVAREKRIFTPESNFERAVLQSLERGTLQNLVLDHPASGTQTFLRGLIGAFLKCSPVKRALMSDLFRSVFLKSMHAGVKLVGKGWATRV